MRIVCLVCLLLPGCSAPVAGGEYVLTVVPSSGAPHVVAWNELDDGSAIANFVESGLANAAGSAYGTSSQAINGTLAKDVAKWMDFQQTAHGRPLPVRYDGHLFLVSFDAA